jgi:hypothetical protein
MSTDTLPDTLAELQRLIDQVSERLDAITAAVERLPTTAAPAFYPERMGYLSEVRHGDRVLFAGGWREVAGVEHRSDAVRMWFTDPVMDPLTDKGTHAIRIQKRADEQQADALHRRDNGGL